MEQGVQNPADFQKFNLQPGKARFGNPTPRTALPPPYYRPPQHVGQRIAPTRDKDPGSLMYSGSLLTLPASSGVAADMPGATQKVRMPMEALAHMATNIGAIQRPPSFTANELHYQHSLTAHRNAAPFIGHPQGQIIPSRSDISTKRSTLPEHQMTYPNVQNAFGTMVYRGSEGLNARENNLQQRAQSSGPEFFSHCSPARFPPPYLQANMPPLSYHGRAINGDRPRHPLPPYMDKAPPTRPELTCNYFPFYDQRGDQVRDPFNPGQIYPGRFPSSHNHIPPAVNSVPAPAEPVACRNSQQNRNKNSVVFNNNIVCTNLFEDCPSVVSSTFAQTQDRFVDKNGSSLVLTEHVQRPWFLDSTDISSKEETCTDSLCNSIFGRWYKPPTDEDNPVSDDYEYLWDELENEEFATENNGTEQSAVDKEAVKIHRPVKKSCKGRQNKASRLENQISRIYNSVQTDRVSPVEQVLNDDSIGREVSNAMEDLPIFCIDEKNKMQADSLQSVNQSQEIQTGSGQNDLSTRLNLDHELNAEEHMLSVRTTQNVVQATQSDPVQEKQEQSSVSIVNSFSCSENISSDTVILDNTSVPVSDNSIQPTPHAKKSEKWNLRIKSPKKDKKEKTMKAFGFQKKVSPIKIKKCTEPKSTKRLSSKKKQLKRGKKKNQENVAHEIVKQKKPHKRNLLECFSNVDNNKKVLRVEPFHCSPVPASPPLKNGENEAIILNQQLPDEAGVDAQSRMSAVDDSDLLDKNLSKRMTITGDTSDTNINQKPVSACDSDISVSTSITEVSNLQKQQASPTKGKTSDHLLDVVSKIQNSRKRRRSAVMLTSPTPALSSSGLFSTVVPDSFCSPKRRKVSNKTVFTTPSKIADCSVVLEDHFKNKPNAKPSNDRSRQYSEDSRVADQSDNCSGENNHVNLHNEQVSKNECEDLQKEVDLSTDNSQPIKGSAKYVDKDVDLPAKDGQIVNNVVGFGQHHMTQNDTAVNGPGPSASTHIEKMNVDEMNNDDNDKNLKRDERNEKKGDLGRDKEVIQNTSEDRMESGPRQESPITISSESDGENDVDNNLNTSFKEDFDINRINKSSFYVRFHGERILCLSKLNNKYFIMREFLRNCFQKVLQKTSQSQGSHQNHSYKHIYVAKERDLNIPYKELPDCLRSQVTNYLVKENLLKPSQKVMHIGIIHVSDAKRLYHFFYGVKTCGDVNCISEWSADWMPRKRSSPQSDQSNLVENKQDVPKENENTDLNKEAKSVDKQKTNDIDNKKQKANIIDNKKQKTNDVDNKKKKGKSRSHSKGKKKSKSVKKLSEKEKRKTQEEATSQYLAEILQKKTKHRKHACGSDNSDAEVIKCHVIYDDSAEDSDATIPYVEQDDMKGTEQKKNNVSENSDMETRELPENNVDYVVKGGIAELFGGFFRFLVVNSKKFYPFSDLCNHFDKEIIHNCIKVSPEKYKAIRCSPVERDFLNPLEPKLPVLSENATIVEESLLYNVAKISFQNMFGGGDEDENTENNSLIETKTQEKNKTVNASNHSNNNVKVNESSESDDVLLLNTAEDMVVYEINSSPRICKKNQTTPGKNLTSGLHSEGNVPPVSHMTDVNKNKVKVNNPSPTNSKFDQSTTKKDGIEEEECETIYVTVDNSGSDDQESQDDSTIRHSNRTIPQTRSAGGCEDSFSKQQESIAVACEGLLQQNASLKDRLIRMKNNKQNEVPTGTKKFEEYEAEIASLINQMKKKKRKK